MNSIHLTWMTMNGEMVCTIMREEFEKEGFLVTGTTYENLPDREKRAYEAMANRFVKIIEKKI